MPKLSEIHRKRIFDTGSNFIGTTSDIMINAEEGKVAFILKDNVKSILGRDRDYAKEFIKKNFIPIEKVKAMGKVIIISD